MLGKSTIVHVQEVKVKRSTIFNVYSKLYCSSCPGNGKVQLGNSTTFHAHVVENFSWGFLLYFKSTKWKCLTGEIYDISCPQSGKLQLESSMIFYVHEVENFNWRTLQYFIFTKWKCLARKLYEIIFPQSGKRLTGKLTQISCPRP